MSTAVVSWRIAELIALYIMAPVAAALIVWIWRVPLFVILLPTMAILILALLRDPTFSVRAMLSSPIAGSSLLSMLLLLPFGAAIVFGLGWWIEPERFLAFPRDRFWLWLTIMALYPLVPVIAQELLFRVVFWHRYGVLFEGRPWLAIVVNAALFGFAHIIMRNWIAVILSFLAGLVLAWRYQRRRSFWAAVLEHGIYGDMIFTAGLGLYFFSGAVR